MKRGLIIFITVLCLLIRPTPVSAQSNNELLPHDQIIDSDYIRAAQTIQIDGEIKGDAFLTGGVVTINGKVDGDLFIVGGKVNINGEVGNSIRVLAGDVTVNSQVGRNILLVCGNCTVTRQANITGSLLVAGGNLEESAGSIGRGFRFLGSRLYLNSVIANEAFVVADKQFLLGPEASISGNLKYTGGHEVIKEPGATVAGTIAYQKISQGETYPKFFGARTILNSYERIKPLTDLFGFVVSAVVGFILLGLFSKGFEKAILAIENQPYASLGWGLIGVLMMPLVAILFALTIVGIPVSLVLLIVSYLLLVGAKFVIAFFIGRRILLTKFGERRGWALVLGLFIIYLLGLIPLAGALVKAVLMVLAIGGMVLAYKQPIIIQPRSLPLSVRGKSKARKSPGVK